MLGSNARTHNRCDNKGRVTPVIPGATITSVRNKKGQWVTAYVSTFNDYEFVIRKSLGRWVASCYQVDDGWEYQFPIITPVSDICPALEEIAIDWSLEAQYYAEDFMTDGLPPTNDTSVLLSDQYGVFA